MQRRQACPKLCRRAECKLWNQHLRQLRLRLRLRLRRQLWRCGPLAVGRSRRCDRVGDQALHKVPRHVLHRGRAAAPRHGRRRRCSRRGRGCGGGAPRLSRGIVCQLRRRRVGARLVLRRRGRGDVPPRPPLLRLLAAGAVARQCACRDHRRSRRDGHVVIHPLEDADQIAARLGEAPLAPATAAGRWLRLRWCTPRDPARSTRATSQVSKGWAG